MKGVRIPDETRKTIYDRIAAGDKIADIAADTGVAASTLRRMRQQAARIPDTDPEVKTAPKGFRADWEATRYWVLRGLKKAERYEKINPN